MNDKIKQAFAADDFKVVNEYALNGKKGYCAEHLTAKNMVNGKKKRAYYVEGNSYEMGYLLGYLAREEVEIMGTTFIENIIFEFLKNNPHEFWPLKIIKHLIKKYIQKNFSHWIYELSIEIFKDIPYQYKQEIHGLADGYRDACKTAGHQPLIDFDDLWTLNVGVDCLLAFIYAPDIFIERLPKFIPKPKSSLFRIPSLVMRLRFSAMPLVIRLTVKRSIISAATLCFRPPRLFKIRPVTLSIIRIRRMDVCLW